MYSVEMFSVHNHISLGNYSSKHVPLILVSEK